MPSHSPRAIGAAMRRLLAGLATCVLLIAVSWGTTFAHAMPAGGTGATSSWATFTDPVYGFSLRYPTSWNLLRGYDGSHITLAHGNTDTTISPIVESQSGSVTSVLHAAASIGGATVRQITVDGAQAVDVTQPFTPGSAKYNPAGPLVTRTVTLATAHTSSATTTYALQLTVKTDARGHLSAAAQADVTTFEDIVQSFRLPRTGAAPRSPSPQASSPNNCWVVCWADHNWNYNEYTDGNGPDCSLIYFPNGVETCETGSGSNYNWEVTAPAGHYQPDFQCAEFVSRALAQGYLVPGLINGGQLGFSGTVTGHQGQGWDFGKYSMTAYPDNSTSQYWLTDVGGYGNPTGLFDYLNNNGFGYDVLQDIWSANAGDVIFFYDGSTFGHVMLITNTYEDSNHVWHVIADGHNFDQLQVDVADRSATGSASGFELVHINMTESQGLTARPSLWNSGRGPSWSGTLNDGWGVPFNYVRMTGNSTYSASASLGWSGNTWPTCGVAMFVPNSSDASANVTVTVGEANGGSQSTTVNENNIYGAALLFSPGGLSSPPTSIYVTNQGGTTSQYLGVGAFFYFC